MARKVGLPHVILREELARWGALTLGVLNPAANWRATSDSFRPGDVIHFDLETGRRRYRTCGVWGFEGFLF